MLTRPVAAASAQPVERMLAFRVGGERFALPAAAVREVVRRPRTVRVPHAPESLLGLANLRGAVVPVVALGGLLGREVTQGGRVIILERTNPVGLLVDEILEVTSSDGANRLEVDRLLSEAFGAAQPARRGGRARAAPASSTSSADRGDDVTLLAFSVSGQDYALPIGQVDEIIALPEHVTAMPMSDAVVLGSVARRDRLLPLLSLRELLGLSMSGAARAPRAVIVRIGTQRVGLVVDAVQSVLRLAESEIDPVPAVLTRGTAEARIQAICRLDGGARLVSVLATDHLLRADLTGALPQQRSEGDTALDNQARSAETEQFLIFRVGEQDFGMPVIAVREVAGRPAALARVPKAPAFVEGVMNLRGRPVPVIDQRRRFETGAADQQRQRVIVAAIGDGEAGFLVDAVSEVLRIPLDAITPAPELANEGTALFDRVANIDGRIILIVDPKELLDRAERDLLAVMHDRGGAAAK